MQVHPVGVEHARWHHALRTAGVREDAAGEGHCQRIGGKFYKCKGAGGERAILLEDEHSRDEVGVIAHYRHNGYIHY